MLAEQKILDDQNQKEEQLLQDQKIIDEQEEKFLQEQNKESISSSNSESTDENRNKRNLPSDDEILEKPTKLKLNDILQQQVSTSSDNIQISI